MNFVLLLKHKLPHGQIETIWEVFSTYEAAKIRLERFEQESTCQWGHGGAIQLGPVLVQSLIMRVEVCDG